MGELTVNSVLTPPHWFAAVIVVVPVIPELETNPVIGSIVATLLMLLVQVPTGAPLLLNVVVAPKQIIAGPVMTLGAAETVTVIVAAIPQPVLYEITDEPVETPVTTPLVEPGPVVTVATDVETLVHVPPTELLLKVVVSPIHTAGVPDIATGLAFTVTVVVAVPHPLE